MPWVMMVDSSATSGRPLARASATSGETSIRSAARMVFMTSSGPIIVNPDAPINAAATAAVKGDASSVGKARAELESPRRLR